MFFMSWFNDEFVIKCDSWSNSGIDIENIVRTDAYYSFHKKKCKNV